MKSDTARIAVEECPWRTKVRHAGTPEEEASCRLLGEITGIEDESLFIAKRKNCTSCVHKFEPARDRINPLIATLLFQLSDRISERGGIEGYGLEKAKELKKFAMSHLPVFGSAGWAQAAKGAESKAPCFYLGAQTGERKCTSCSGSVRQKVFACTHELHDETTRLDCKSCLDYEPALARNKVRSWAACVTTSPRTDATLEQSLRSLEAAGWPTAHVFAEPGSPLPEGLDPERLTMRTKKLGAWPNWFLSLHELMMRTPHADAYLICQDDVLYCNGLRTYLEEELWPASRLGVVSLHTASHQDQAHEKGFYAADHGWSAWGAQAYVFPNAAARALVRHHRVVNHRGFGPRGGTCNVDSVVGQWALESGLSYYLHSPSLTQHIGETSTLWGAVDTTGRRRAATFVGEQPDIRDYMNGTATAQPDSTSRQAPTTTSMPQPVAGDPGVSLGIVAVHIGRWHSFDRWKDWILHADIPPQTALYLVDNSNDVAFGKVLAAATAEFMASRRFRGVSLRLGPGPVQDQRRLNFDRFQNIAQAFNLVLGDVREDFVLTVDDDTIPPSHAPATLLSEYRERVSRGEKIGLISGLCESANRPGHLAISRSSEQWTDGPTLAEVAKDEVLEVGFAGNACALFERDALHEILPLKPEGEPGGECAGPDHYFCRSLRERGYTLLAHGGVFCDHLF